jgi:uncharacterized protein
MALTISPALDAALTDFVQRWRVRELSLFGSALRDDFGPASDVDVLIDFEADAFWGIDEWIVMRDELEALFGRRVDLVSRDSLRNPFVRAEVLRTRRVLHAA